MIRYARRGLGLALAIAVLTLQGDAAVRQEALGGVYLVEGVNPDGAPYTGVVELTATGAQWQLHYRFEPAGEAVGIGLLQGDVLAVIFQTESGLIGMTAFAVDRSKTPMVLRGQWVVPGHDAVLTETLTRTNVRDPAMLQGPRTGV